MHIKIKQNQSLNSPIYTGSTLSLDFFESEGYLRPHTDELYEDVLLFFSAVCAVLTTTFILVLVMIAIYWLKRKDTIICCIQNITINTN